MLCLDKYLDKCKKVKVDGLIVVDLPYPENKSFANKCKRKSINFIQLLSPTTSKDRMKKIIYCAEEDDDHGEDVRMSDYATSNTTEKKKNLFLRLC
mgnify:CR=1 FL=1